MLRYRKVDSGEEKECEKSLAHFSLSYRSGTVARISRGYRKDSPGGRVMQAGISVLPFGCKPIYPQLCPFAIFFAFVSIPKPRACPAGPPPGPKNRDSPHFEILFRTPRPSTPLCRPDWFRLPAAPTRLAAAELICAAACFRTGAASSGSRSAVTSATGGVSAIVQPSSTVAAACSVVFCVSILGPHQALLALAPSANRQSIGPTQYTPPLTRNRSNSSYTNQDSQTEL